MYLGQTSSTIGNLPDWQAFNQCLLLLPAMSMLHSLHHQLYVSRYLCPVSIVLDACATCRVPSRERTFHTNEKRHNESVFDAETQDIQKRDCLSTSELILAVPPAVWPHSSGYLHQHGSRQRSVAAKRRINTLAHIHWFERRRTTTAAATSIYERRRNVRRRKEADNRKLFFQIRR